MRTRPDGDNHSAARLLDAAEGLLAERGYDGMSLRDVAARAGVNKGLIHYYFGTKAELFDRILERYYTAHRELFERAFAVPGTLEERVHRVIDAYFDFIDANRLYPRLVQLEVARSGGRLGRIRASIGDLGDWLDRALADVAPREGPRSAKHVYLTFLGATLNYFTYAPVLDRLWAGDPLALPARSERREHLHWVADLILGGLGPRAGSAGSAG